MAPAHATIVVGRPRVGGVDLDPADRVQDGMAEPGPSPVVAPGQARAVARVAVAQVVRAEARDMAAAPVVDQGAADGRHAEACSGRLTLPGGKATSA